MNLTTSQTMSVDLIVAGGGSAGCAAAIAAARRGHEVLLLEESNALGGTSTTGGVYEWFASLEGLGDVFDEVRRRLSAFHSIRGRHFNGEHLKLIWQMMAQEAGVRVQLRSSILAADASQGRVREVAFASCSRLIAAEGRAFIDCTGEGDLAALCGAEFRQGDGMGRTLHMTLTFLLHDTAKPVPPHLPQGLEPITDETGLPGLQARAVVDEGLLYCNMTKIVGHDPTDPVSVTAAELEARRQVARIVHYLQRTTHPTYVLCATGAAIGVREGRRVTGDYVLSEHDILGPGPCDFPDGVAVATSQIDFHSLTKAGNDGWRERVEPYAIPLRSLTVKDFGNLLVAGKCVSADQVVQSSLRMTPTCCAMGQAAGTAAAMMLEENLGNMRELEVADLRRELVRAGMELDPRQHAAFAPSTLETREHSL